MARLKQDRSARVTRIVETLSAGAIFVAAALAALGPTPDVSDWKAAAFFAAYGLIASSLSYRLSSATTGHIGFLPFLTIAVISPNVAAVAAIFVAIVASEIIAKRQLIKAVFNVSQYVFVQAAAVGIYNSLGGVPFSGRDMSLRSVAALVAMVTCWLSLNKLAVVTVIAASSGKDTREGWLNAMRMSAVYDIFSLPLIYLFAVAYVEFGPLITAALAFPMLGVRQFYRQNVALQRINEDLLQLMVANVEAQDPYTSGHSQRVARYARVIARAGGIGGRSAERIAVAALLHDVGKIYPEFSPILRKPGRLTDAEYEVMKSHPARGAALLETVSILEDIVPAVVSHHEAWDGRGYPNGLSGERIPIAARIIAIADTIDAMTTSRPYRDALSPETVRQEIDKERGRQFDPQLCAALLRPDAWAELESELSIATSEYPVHSERGSPDTQISPRGAHPASFHEE